MKMNDIQIKVGSQIRQPMERKEKQEDLKQISAKLHPEYDQDLKDLIRKIPKRERSKIYRDALRKYLKDGIG